MQDKGAAERSRTADFRMQAIFAPETKAAESEEVGVMKFQDLQFADSERKGPSGYSFSRLE